VPHSTQVGSSSQGGQGNGGEEDSEQLRSVGKGSDGDFFLFWRERERESHVCFGLDISGLG
jgi:hypothetical protein